MSKNEEDIYLSIRKEHLALEILRTLLLKEPSGRSNDAILYRFLRELALCETTDELRGAINRLVSNKSWCDQPQLKNI